MIKTGEFLKTLRKDKGITQEQLAEQLGVSRRSVSRWETGSNMPDIDVLIELAYFYGVEITEIIDGERRDDAMTEKTGEIVRKVAEYTEEDKARLLRVVRIDSIMGLAGIFIGLIMMTRSPAADIPVYDYIEGACFGLAVGALVTMLLYSTGLLMKLDSRKLKHKKIILIACAIIIALTFAAAAIATIF